MEQLGNKLIEINIIDSDLLTTAPITGTGSDFFNMVTKSLSSVSLTTILLTALITASVMCFVAIILSRLHHNKNRSSKFSKSTGVLSRLAIGFAPIITALAVVITPIIRTIATNDRDSLDSSPISITVDKATALTASDETIVTLHKVATSHVDIYADLDTIFSNNLGTNLFVSATNTHDSNSTTDLSTTDTLIYTTGPVEAGDTEVFNVTVSITENLPVGTYRGQVTFYGEFFQQTPPAITSLQEFAKDPSVCIPNPAAHVYVTKTLRDERDDKIYRVRCMPDGHWWMIDNLDIALERGTEINSKGTDFALYNPIWEPIDDTNVVAIIKDGVELTPQQVIDKYAPESSGYSLVTSMKRLYNSVARDISLAVEWPIDGVDMDDNVAGTICPAGWTVPENQSYEWLFAIWAEATYIDEYGNQIDWNIFDTWMEDPSQSTATFMNPDIFDAKLGGLYWNGAGHIGQNIAGYLWSQSSVIAYGMTQGIKVDKGHGDIAVSTRCILYPGSEI